MKQDATTVIEHQSRLMPELKRRGVRLLPDGPEREALFFEAKRIMIAYAPYKNHVHRILTDLAHPWLHGYRRPLYWQDWWQYVDITAPDARGEATG